MDLGCTVEDVRRVGSHVAWLCCMEILSTHLSFNQFIFILFWVGKCTIQSAVKQK